MTIVNTWQYDLQWYCNAFTAKVFPVPGGPTSNAPEIVKVGDVTFYGSWVNRMFTPDIVVWLLGISNFGMITFVMRSSITDVIASHLLLTLISWVDCDFSLMQSISVFGDTIENPVEPVDLFR